MTYPYDEPLVEDIFEDVLDPCDCEWCRPDLYENQADLSFEEIMLESARTLDTELAKLLDMAYQRGYSDALAESSPVTFEALDNERIQFTVDQLNEWAPWIEGELAGLKAQLNALAEAAADIAEGQDERLDFAEADAPVVESLMARQAELEARVEEIEEELEF